MQTITKIEPQKNKLDRVNIHIDGEYFCAMQNFVCVKYGLKVGLQIDKNKLTQIMLESDKEQALNKVSKYLQYGLKTEKQVRDYLKDKGYDLSLQNFVLDKLLEYGFVNDALYVKSYINTYQKKYGKKKLQFELQQKGIDKKIISDALSDFESEIDIVVTLAKKHLKSKEPTFENLQKTSAYLASKGFDWGEIKEAINQLKNKQ